MKLKEYCDNYRQNNIYLLLKGGGQSFTDVLQDILNVYPQQVSEWLYVLHVKNNK